MFGQIGQRLSDPLIILSECFPKMLERAGGKLATLIIIPAGVGSQFRQRMSICTARSCAYSVPCRGFDHIRTGFGVPIFLFHDVSYYIQPVFSFFKAQRDT